MSDTYSTYEAKARFSEIIRKVRSGKHVRITYRGREVAEVVRIRGDEGTLEGRMRRLEEDERLDPQTPPAPVALTPLLRKRGALKRFLESRD